MKSTDRVNFPIKFIDEVSDSKNETEVLKSIASHLRSFIPADRASLTLATDQNTLRLFAIDGNDIIETDKELPIESTMIGEVYKSQQVLIEPDLVNSHYLDCQMLAQGGLGSCVDAPLATGDECYGTLNAASETVGFYTDEHSQVLRAMARWAAAQIRIHRQIDTLVEIADHDAQTGLLNRKAHDSTLSRWAEQNNPDNIAYILIDLDGFKQINDTFGHKAGDEVLVQVAKRLSENVRDGDAVARIGGDEFVIILRNLAEEVDVASIAMQYISDIERPVEFGGDMLQVGCSIGIALSSEIGNSPAALNVTADIAMYLAKDNQESSFRIGRAIAQQTAGVSISQREAISALNEKQFVLLGQPIVDLGSQRCTEIQALPHWQHPTLGLLPPEKYWEILTDVRHIDRYSALISERTAMLASAIDEMIGSGISVSIGIPHQILAVESKLRIALKPLLERPEQFTLVVTEQIFSGRAQRTIQQNLDYLTGIGFRVALDGFGSGYTSLRHLTESSISEVRIKPDYISDIGSNQESEQHIVALVTTAIAGGAVPVAPAVSTIEQLVFLQSLGCSHFQGSLFGSPATIEELPQSIDDIVLDRLPGNSGDSVPNRTEERFARVRTNGMLQ